MAKLFFVGSTVYSLLFLQIGDRSDSTVYIKSKVKAAEEVNVNIESETGW